MKTQICLLFIIVMLAPSCVTFRHANYVKNTQELPQKLPKLALEIDTSSISAVFNQYQYIYGRYPIIYGGQYSSSLKPNNEYLNIPETFINVYLPSTPDQFKNVIQNLSFPKILNVITHKKYSMPDISKKGLSHWGSNWNGSNLDTIILHRNGTEFLSANLDFTNKKVAIESSWTNYLKNGPRDRPISKLEKPYKTTTSRFPIQYQPQSPLLL